jgi:hypothetical protein
MSYVLRWSVGNGKLKKTHTVSFNLPAFRSADGFTVCPQAGKCASVCYARQGRYLLPDAVQAREVNLDIVRTSLPLFERLACADLRRIKARSIRIHDSGDFFSQAYFDTWCRIVARFPRKRFYCYTKSLHLDLSARPANLRIVQSLGGKLDARVNKAASHTRIFASAAERRAAGYQDGNQTDRPAQTGVIRIGFVYHGSTPLSPAMARVLRADNPKL